MRTAPRLDPHNHAFYLPTDEDCDGRIDHLTIYAAGQFSRDDVSALDRLRSLSFGKEGEAEEDGPGISRRRTTHRLLLVGLDREKPIGVSAFGPAKVWVSATPYIAFRHLKESGKKRDDRAFIQREAMPEFIRHVLGEDWEQRSELAELPKPEIAFLPDPLTGVRLAVSEPSVPPNAESVPRRRVQSAIRGVPVNLSRSNCGSALSWLCLSFWNGCFSTRNLR